MVCANFLAMAACELSARQASSAGLVVPNHPLWVRAFYGETFKSS